MQLLKEYTGDTHSLKVFRTDTDRFGIRANLAIETNDKQYFRWIEESEYETYNLPDYSLGYLYFVLIDFIKSYNDLLTKVWRGTPDKHLATVHIDHGARYVSINIPDEDNRKYTFKVRGANANNLRFLRALLHPTSTTKFTRHAYEVYLDIEKYTSPGVYLQPTTIK